MNQVKNASELRFALSQITHQLHWKISITYTIFDLYSSDVTQVRRNVINKITREKKAETLKFDLKEMSKTLIYDQ